MAYMLTGLGCGCNCGGTCAKGLGADDFGGESGMDWDFSGSSGPALSLPDLPAIPVWGWIAGGLAAFWLVSGSVAKGRAKRRIYRDYKRRLDEADRTYSTTGRVKRAAGRARRAVPKVTFGI